MKKNIIYILLIVALVITTVVNVAERMTVENEAKSVEITLSYAEIDELSQQSEHDILWWFKHFKSLNAYSVSLTEESFKSLVEAGYELELEVLKNIKNDTLWEMRYPSSFVSYIKETDYDINDVIVVSEDQALKSFILDGLDARYPESFYTLYEEGDLYAILLDGRPEDLRYNQVYKSLDAKQDPILQHQDVVGSALYYYGLGFSEDKINNILEAGLEANLRPLNNNRYSDKMIDAFKATLDKYGIKQRMIIFAGKEVLGFPEHQMDLYDYMMEENIVPVLIEAGNQRSNTEQEGLMSLTMNLNYEAIRLMSLDGYLQERFQYYNYDGGEEIENVMFRAITERNIRVIYFRPFLYGGEIYVTDPDEYEASFTRLEERLKSHNIEMGEFSVMPLKTDNMVSGIIIGFGLISIVILASRFFFKLKAWIEYVLLVLGGLLIAAALFVAPNLGRQLLALCATLTISSLGAVFLVSFSRDLFIDKKVFRFRDILLKSVLFTAIMGLLALLGGMIVGGLLSHSKYLLEMQYFRGVKVSEMIPLVVFIVLYLLKFGYDRSAEELKEKEFLPKDLLRFLNVNIKIVYILFAAIAGGILYIYIARSGHETTVQPSNIEMIFRNFLELKLIARPRTKEFLFAIPALMVFAYISMKAYRPLIAIVGVPAMITFTSIVNTFCHLRTPIYLSVARTLIGLGFGILLGIIAISVFEGGERLVKHILKRRLAYESDEKELGA